MNQGASSFFSFNSISKKFDFSENFVFSHNTKRFVLLMKGKIGKFGNEEMRSVKPRLKLLEGENQYLKVLIYFN